MLSMIMLLALTACGGEGSTEGQVSTEPITLRFATQHSTESLMHESAEAIKAEIEEKTNGRVKIDIYPASSLGDYDTIYSELMRGSIDIGHLSVTEKYNPRANVTLLPGLISDYSEIEGTFGKGSFLYNGLAEWHKDTNVKFLGVYCEGLSGTGSSMPIENVDDPLGDKGLLVRCPAIKSFTLAAEEIGYATATIPYGDTFTAIQTGVVDGWVGGPPVLNYLSFRDVIKYYYQTNFQAEATQYLMSMATWNKLSPEEQKIVEDAFYGQAEKSYADVKEQDEYYMDQMKENGIEVITFDKEYLDALANVVRENVWPQLTETYTEELINELLDSYK